MAFFFWGGRGQRGNTGDQDGRTQCWNGCRNDYISTIIYYWVVMVIFVPFDSDSRTNKLAGTHGQTQWRPKRQLQSIFLRYMQTDRQTERQTEAYKKKKCNYGKSIYLLSSLGKSAFSSLLSLASCLSINVSERESLCHSGFEEQRRIYLQTVEPPDPLKYTYARTCLKES